MRALFCPVGMRNVDQCRGVIVEAMNGCGGRVSGTFRNPGRGRLPSNTCDTDQFQAAALLGIGQGSQTAPNRLPISCCVPKTSLIDDARKPPAKVGRSCARLRMLGRRKFTGRSRRRRKMVGKPMLEEGPGDATTVTGRGSELNGATGGGEAREGVGQIARY